MDDFDRRILGALEFDPDRTHTVLAKMLKMRASTVAYRLEKLKEQKTLRRGALINPWKIGFTNVAVYFSLRASTDRALQNLLSDIVQHDRTIWLGSLAGDFQFGLSFLTRRLGEVIDFLGSLADKHHMIIWQKEIVPRMALHCFPRSYLSADSIAKKRVMISMTSNEEPALGVDAFDLQLLSAISEGTWRSIRQLAELVAGPPATVDRRIRRLIELKVIERLVYSVNPESLGVTSYRVLLGTERLETSARTLVLNFCRSHQAVIRVFEGIGTWDFEIDLEAAHPVEIQRFTRQ